MIPINSNFLTRKENFLCQLSYYFLVLILLVAKSSKAQTDLTGSILDASSQPISYANVLLLDNLDSTLIKGTVAKDDGHYVIERIEPGKYILAASMLGFATKQMQIEVDAADARVEIPKIFLMEAASELDVVKVTGKKPLFQQQIDRLVINVQHSITAAGSSALDVLERSPGILVNRENGAISMSGKNGVNILINERLSRLPISALINLLDGMPASNIERIELITTPPAKYDAEGDAGFINIVMIKNESEGYNGSVTASYGLGRKGRGMISTAMNYRKGKLNLYGDYAVSRTNSEAVIRSNRIVRSSNQSIETKSRTDRDGGFDLHNARIGLDYYVSSKTVVGVLASIFERRWSQISVNRATYVYSETPDTSHEGIRNDINNSHQYLFNFNLQHNFDDRQRLNFDLDYFDYFTHQPQDYDNDFYGEDLLLVSNQGIAMDKKTPLNIWVAKLDYKIAVNDQLTFETGLKSAISEFNNRIDLQFNDGDGWKINPLFSDASDFKEKISAAFGSLDLKIDEKTGLKAGLRYEYTDRRLTSNSEGGSSIRQYGNFFPSLFLSRNINHNNSLQFAFSRRITRPTFDQLAPFVLFIEPNTYRTGNPSLRAAITHQFKADYRMKTILFSIQYSVDKDLIASNQPSVDPESNLFVFYSENLDRRETTALTLSLPIYVNDWWEMQNQVTFQHQRLQSEYNRGNINHSKSNANFNTSHTFTAPKGFIIELKGSYRTASIYGVSIREPMGGIDFGLQKSLPDNKGVFSFSVSDVFKTRFFRISSDIQELQLINDFEFDFDSRVARLTFTRSFGNKKVKSRKRKTGSEEERRRVG